MLRHEYGGPTFHFIRKGEDLSPYIAAHLKVLFSNAVKASRRSSAKRIFDTALASFPRPTKLRLVDARNSFALALRNTDLSRLSKTDRQLREIVDATAQKTGFEFSPEQIAHVCAADSMAAVVFATCRSGFVRELGLSHIDRVGTDAGFALVVLRLNDWVPEVRLAAVKAVERIVKYVDEPFGGPAYNIAGATGQLLDDRRFGRSSAKEREFAKSLIEHSKVKDAVRWILLNNKSDRRMSQNLHSIIQAGCFDELIPEIATDAECSHRRLIATRAVLSGVYVWKDEGDIRERQLDFEDYRTDILRSALLDESANVAFAALRYLIESEEFERLDEATVNKLIKRREASLQRRIRLLRTMTGNSESRH